MGVVVRYATGATYALPSTEVAQNTSVLVSRSEPVDGKATLQVSGGVLSKTACLWHKITAISLDAGVTYQAVYDVDIKFDGDSWSGIFPYTLSLTVGAMRLGAQVLWPLTGTKWGLATQVAVHQDGNANGRAGIVYLGPDCYFSLLQSTWGLGTNWLTFTRALAKTVTGVTYAANVPVFGIGGMLVSEATSQDVPTVLLPVATVRTVAARLTVYGAPTGTVTVWTAAHNKLTINLTAGTMSLTDDTTTVSCTFPSTAYLAGTAVTVIVAEGASHAVTIACGYGTTWTTASGTLAALLWTNTLTIGNLKGWIAHLTQWPYVLTSAEYQAIHWPGGPLTWNTMSIAHKATGTLTLDESGVLLDAAGNDLSGLVTGRVALPANGTLVDITMTEGLSSRWYATSRDTMP